MICPICYTAIADKKTLCNHYFCEECLEKWKKIRSTCPMCRALLSRILPEVGSYVRLKHKTYDFEVDGIYVGMEETTSPYFVINKINANPNWLLNNGTFDYLWDNYWEFI